MRQGRSEAYAYLKATLEAIAAGHPSARIDELMPGSLTSRPDTAYVVLPNFENTTRNIGEQDVYIERYTE
jgi:hypothetical protein